MHFPNFRTIYHGHGATSYQNVQVDNHNAIPVPTNYIDKAEIHDLAHTYHHAAIVPIEETHNDIDHIDIIDAGESKLTINRFSIQSINSTREKCNINITLHTVFTLFLS